MTPSLGRPLGAFAVAYAILTGASVAIFSWIDIDANAGVRFGILFGATAYGTHVFAKLYGRAPNRGESHRLAAMSLLIVWAISGAYLLATLLMLDVLRELQELVDAVSIAVMVAIAVVVSLMYYAALYFGWLKIGEKMVPKTAPPPPAAEEPSAAPNHAPPARDPFEPPRTDG